MAKVWKVPNTAGIKNHLTQGCIPYTYHSNTLFYSLFSYDAFNRRWIQVRDRVYTSEKIAFMVFKEDIIKAPLSMSIRRVRRIECPKAQGMSRFPSVSYKPSKEFVKSEYQEMSEVK